MLNTNLSIAPGLHAAGRQKAPAFGEGIVLSSSEAVVTSDVTRMPVFLLYANDANLDHDDNRVDVATVGSPFKNDGAYSPLLDENGNTFSHKENEGNNRTLKAAATYLNNRLNPKSPEDPMASGIVA